MKSFLYGAMAAVIAFVLMLVWLGLVGATANGFFALMVIYVPWGIIAYYWWRTWKSERHERLVL